MQRPGVAMVLSWGLIFVMTTASGQEVKVADCPAAVRKTFETEGREGRIESVHQEKAEDRTIYWARLGIAGKTYAIGVLEDGTLIELSLAVDDEGLPFERCPAPVQATFRREAFGEAVREVGKDVKFGVTIYQAVVPHRGRSYEIAVAEDGTLVEKVLVIDDQEIELTKCPAAVQAALKEHARGGTIGDVTRYGGITRPTFEAEVHLKDKVYRIEVTEGGLLVSKSLEAGEE